jgi:hypothetical protein
MLEMLHINIFASALHLSLRIVEQQTGDDQDILIAAVTSSQLERAVAMSTEDLAPHKELLAKCDRLLKQYPIDIDLALMPSLKSILISLKAYADSKHFARDINTGTDCLLSIDSLISLAVVACRIGWIGEKELNALSKQASEEVWKLAANLSDLWEYAENREQQFAPASDYPEAFSFWEELAQLSITRLDLQEAMTLRTEDEKDAIIKRVLASLTS